MRLNFYAVLIGTVLAASQGVIAVKLTENEFSEALAQVNQIDSDLTFAAQISASAQGQASHKHHRDEDEDDGGQVSGPESGHENAQDFMPPTRQVNIEQQLKEMKKKEAEQLEKEKKKEE